MKSSELLAEIEKNISLGMVPQSLLGQKTSAEKSEPQLSNPAEFKRYLESLQPQIENALHETRRVEQIIIVLLVILFAVALGLSIAANILHWPWHTQALTVPGLGIGAYGAVHEISRVLRENLALRLLPGMLPFLPTDQAATVIRQILKRSEK
jgi:hypothetical protein